MKKYAVAVAVFVATLAGFQPAAQAVSPGQSVLVCHAVGDGTYTPVHVILTDTYVASTVGGYKNGGPDIIAPFTFSTQYDELNVAGQNWLMQKTVTYRYYYNRQWHTVTSVLWVANPVTQGIYYAGCAV
jgi:hypothetical protein